MCLNKKAAHGKIHGLKIYRLFAAAGTTAAGAAAVAVITSGRTAAVVTAAAILRAWLRSRAAVMVFTGVIFLARREELINREVKA